MILAGGREKVATTLSSGAFCVVASEREASLYHCMERLAGSFVGSVVITVAVRRSGGQLAVGRSAVFSAAAEVLRRSRSDVSIIGSQS